MYMKAMPQFFSYVRQCGLRWTPEREKILQEALGTEGHFEADDLAYRLRKNGDRVSKATIYRTLPLLVKAGLLHQVARGEKHQHYELANEGSHHDHLICLKCGKTIELGDAALREAEEKICRRYHFNPQKILVEIFGYCQRCQ
jgi:Fur family ferric uptake transcriptional regulator